MHQHTNRDLYTIGRRLRPLLTQPPARSAVHQSAAHPVPPHTKTHPAFCGVRWKVFLSMNYMPVLFCRNFAVSDFICIIQLSGTASHNHQNTDRDDCGQRQGDQRTLGEAGDDIAHEGAGYGGQCVRQLGVYVVDVVTLRTGGRHDGRI